MSEQASIDGLKFAREAKRLHGELPVDALPRLDDVLFEHKGRVRFALVGSVDGQGKPILEVEVDATLPLVCQRCLGRMDYELRRRSRLILVAEGQGLPEVSGENPDVEAVPSDEVANVADLVEQEVLLGLPIAPMHSEGQCSAASKSTSEHPASPFAMLRELKKS